MHSCMATVDNGRTEIVAVRLTKKIGDLLSQVAQARGLDESSVVREALHRYLATLNLLSDDEKKMLGVTV